MTAGSEKEANSLLHLAGGCFAYVDRVHQFDNKSTTPKAQGFRGCLKNAVILRSFVDKLFRFFGA